nr:ribonuclease H-like domain-containing protein [Tanacetum cinerariifolium]
MTGGMSRGTPRDNIGSMHVGIIGSTLGGPLEINVEILRTKAVRIKRLLDDFEILLLRSVCYTKMDQDSTYMVAASKVPMLKPCEYELWMRMEHYIQMIDYSLWDVIDNGNAPPITQVVEGVETTIAPTTAEEKAQRRYVVPTGRVIVPTGRYVVPAGSDNESDDASVHNEATNTQKQQNIQPQIFTTISNNNAKFPYLKKDEYKVWAMKMEYWITNYDMNIWKRESKARTTLLQSIPDDHVADFHYMDDARIYGMQSELEGLHKGYDRMQKILNQLNQLKAKPEDEDINLKFLRVLPSSWSQVASTLKTKDGLELLSFDDLYYKLKTLKVDVKGYTTFSSSQSTGLSHSAFVSAIEQQLAYEDFEQIEKLDLEEMDLKWQMAMLSVRVHKFEQKAERKIDFDKKESARVKGGNNKQRYSSFNIKEIGKKEEDSKALITIDTLVDWTNHDSESDGVITAKEFSMSAGCDSKDAIEEGAAKIYNLITGADTEEAGTAYDTREFALIGVTFERNSSKNLFRLINSSMSVRTKVGLGFNNCIREDKLGWDDSAFSVFTTNSEDVKGRPLFNRFAKADSMKVVPPPLSGDYTSLSDHIDLDEPQMSYGTKSSTSRDSKSMSNDFISCDDSDKSLEVNTNDFASSDSSFKLITLSFHHHKSHQDIRKSKEENRWRKRT